MKETLLLPAELDGRIWSYHFSGHLNRMHHHDELEINFVTRGRATYLLGDRKYEMRRHDLVWLFPEQDHILLDQTPDLEMWILVFKPHLVERASTQASTRTLRAANPSGDFCRRVSESQALRLTRFFQEIESAENDIDRYNTGLAYALTLSWAAHCATEVLTPSQDVHPCVEKAARLIVESGEHLSLEVLSRRVGMSTSSLSRLFKAQIGASLVEFRNRQKIERFLELYGTGHRYSLHEAALQSGFGSYPQFHRVFKQMMGYAPAQHGAKQKSL